MILVYVKLIKTKQHRKTLGHGDFKMYHHHHCFKEQRSRAFLAVLFPYQVHLSIQSFLVARARLGFKTVLEAG